MRQIGPAQIGNCQLPENIIQNRGRHFNSLIALNLTRWLKPGKDKGIDEFKMSGPLDTIIQVTKAMLLTGFPKTLGRNTTGNTGRGVLMPLSSPASAMFDIVQSRLNEVKGLTSGPRRTIVTARLRDVRRQLDAFRKPGLKTAGNTLIGREPLVADELRKLECIVEWDYENRSLKSQMRRADRANAHYVVIVGEHEIKTKVAAVRDMETKNQDERILDEKFARGLVAEIAKK